MKINNKLKSALLAAGAVFFFGACDKDFEEVNKNPNGPIAVPAELLVTGIVENTADRLVDTFLGGDMGHCWAQQWAKVQYNDEARYQPRTTVLNNTWNGFYSQGLKDAQAMYDLAIAENNPNLQGVALTMSAYIYSLLTDMYGDIPFSQSLKAENGVTTPAYDTQEKVYQGLDSMLTKASELLDETSSISSSSDILFAGSVAKWEKFNNSLHIRVLMRQSAKVDVSAKLAAIVNNKMIFESNADDAELKYIGANPNANPVWNTVVFGSRNEWKVCETIVDMLVDNADPRLSVYAQENEDGDYRGAAAGYAVPTVNGYDYANTSPIGAYFLDPASPAVFMSYAELQFLLAEAAKKGYIGGGDAKAAEYYVAGITASLSKYSIPTAAINTYVASTNVSYDAATALRRIGEQKWLALFGQGVEAWTEWRRTGFPALTPAQEAYITEIPSRYLYPSDEETLNNANFKVAADRMGGNLLTTKVWWMQ